jgi:NAD(P) transhydrogenase
VRVPQEAFPNECRVALTPQNVALLSKKDFAEVLVKRDDGAHAQFLNEDYEKAGAKLTLHDQLFDKTDIMLKVQPPLCDQEVNLIIG